MLTLIARKNVKIVLVTLSLFLMFLAEPLLARRVHQKSGKLTQQNLKTRQSSNAGKARTRVTAAKPKSMLRRTKFRERGNFVKSDSRQSRRVNPSRPATRTPGTALDASKLSTGRFDAGKHARGSFDAVKHARGSFDAGRLAGGNFNASRHARGSFDAGRLTQTGRNRDPIERTIRLEQRLRHIHGRYNSGQPYRPYPRSRIYRRIVRPSYRRIVYYNRGPGFTFRYFYPYHHRKYVFVSLGGYWPLGYSYLRYYRYGYYPYNWYGYYPAVYEAGGDTFNYYTYNYGDSAGQVSSGIRPVDENTFADVRERLAAQSAQQPAPETLADRYFEDAVKAFEAGDYDTATDRFADAIELEPDDMVLPFAYSQALFADQQYSKAAEVLRGAVSRFAPDKEDVFYPRGLYSSDDILFEQIGQLAATAEHNPLDEDLQLLLGYQLLGAGKLDRAVKPLQQITPDSENAATAAELLELLEKIKTENTQDTNQ